MKTCMYLRKSRADEELEKIGEGSTLNRHRDTLLKKAHEMNLIVVKIHEEIVSGESLNQRPAMLSLLQEVSDGLYDAVLVMDMDRLGRGNMQEQGLILDTFKTSKTKIVTLRKIYDLNDEFDEEYSEFEAFMARKELKIITRRMQRGRLKSVEEGNYIGTYAPFGYKLEGQGRNRLLVPEPETAPIIQLIFELYSKGMGGNNIAHQLNAMGYKTQTGKSFYGNSILNIIKNPIYIGKITWQKKAYEKGDLNKRFTVKLKDKSEWIIVDGKHESIISEELFNTCQNQLNNKTHVPYKTHLTNPLAGLVICSACRKAMVFRPYGNRKPHLTCCNSLCKKNKSSRFDYIEDEVLNRLEGIIEQYKLEVPELQESNNKVIFETAVRNLNNEIDKLNKQKASLHDLLEQGIYNIDTFLERSEIITNKLDQLTVQLQELDHPKKQLSHQEIIDNLTTVIQIYQHSSDANLKNQLLKSYIDSITYSKDKSSKNKDFNLAIKLKL